MKEWRENDMRQEEFLTSFQEALTGKVSDKIIQENVGYYRNYINKEIQAGKMEEEVLRMLGDPRLLAKTIIESQKFATDHSEDTQEGRENWYQKNRMGQDIYGRNEKKQGHSPVSGWIVLGVVVLCLILVLKLVFSVVSFFAPVILVVAIALLIYRMITNKVK